MAKIYAILSGKGGVGKSLAYSEYVSLANGDVIQIGPYIDNLIKNNKNKIKYLIAKTAEGKDEIFEVIEPMSELVINIVKYEDDLKSERNSPIYLMRKPAPKKLIKIKTSNGNIQVTKEHKFLVIRDGNFIKICAAELIEKKDYLLEFNYPKIEDNFEHASGETARLLGYLIGDGYIEKRSKNYLFHVFATSRNLKEIEKTFTNTFGEYRKLKDKRKKDLFRISFCKKDKINKIINEYGVKIKTSSEKEIPSKIFKSNNNICKEFLSALFDCDGYVCKNRNEIQYDTKSEKLAYQVSNLLRTRFKIENQLKESWKRATNGKLEKEKYFKINISGEEILTFHNCIGFRDKFKNERLKEHIINKKFNTNIKLFPFGKILKIIRENSNIDGKKIAEILGCSKQMIYEYEWGLYALSKNSMKKFIETFKKLGIKDDKLEFLENLLNRGYNFRRVEKKEEIDYDKEYVYDFQVCEEGGHFAHATGIVISNTTTAINLGTSLNSLGEDVIIVDGNLTTPNVGIHLGAPIVPTTLNHVLNDQAEIEEAIYEHESGTKIIPASLSLKEAEKINYKRMIEVGKKLKKIADHILIDAAAGLGEEARSAMLAADEIIIVTNPEMSAVTDALKTIKLAEELNKPVTGVIITRYQGGKVDMTIANIKDMLEVPILGIIPEDDAIKESHVMKNSVIYTHPKSDATENYIKTSKRMLGENVKFETPKKGFLSKLFKKMGF